MCKVLQRLGWVHVRTHGSHFIYARPGAVQQPSVPVHGNKTLKPRTQKNIMRQAGLNDADL